MSKTTTEASRSGHNTAPALLSSLLTDRHDKHCPAERGKDPTTPHDYHLVPQERATKEQRTAQIRRTNWSAVFQNAMDSSLERMASGA